MENVNKYARGYFMPPQTSLKWTQKEYITEAPTWCSVDLRDGNQALIVPMNLEEKLEYFQMLVKIGFKEIEVGFPAASETEFAFLRTLIERDLIPDDVTIQVLTQSREHIIRKTFESLRGTKKAVVHLYNSTSVAQREQVFRKSKEEIIDIAVTGAKLLKECAEETEGNFQFQYSPESFTGTEIEFSLEICNSVLDVWQPTADNPVIINLPATVSMSMPHVYASQIEYMSEHLKYRDNVIVSIHPHNDRGTGVADAELGMLAGAQRVEGTLFGNGERTGNVDVVTLALNMFTQGVDPELDCSDIERIKSVYEYANEMVIPERHPYVGELVYTAFSGSHQDAINKGMKAIKVANKPLWEVPYLPIDPQDVGRTYEAIIRINSQSGKGGIAYILQADYGLNLPRNLQVEFREIIQQITDEEGKELPSRRIHDEFQKHYVTQPDARIKFVDHQTVADPEHKGRRIVTAEITDNGVTKNIEGRGTGPIDGFVDALSKYLGVKMSVVDYSEHSLQQGSDASAISYVEMAHPGGKLFGVGINDNIVSASLEAVVSAANRVISR